jgi:hypothetical protein
MRNPKRVLLLRGTSGGHPDNTRRYFAVRGRVVATTTEGGAENIDEISGKYRGRPYPNSGLPETRVIMTIEADSVRGMGAG